MSTVVKWKPVMVVKFLAIYESCKTLCRKRATYRAWGESLDKYDLRKGMSFVKDTKWK